MNATMKLLGLSAMALMFAMEPTFAKQTVDEDDTEEVAPKKKGKKAKKAAPVITRMYVAIDKFDNKAGVDANQFNTIRARVQQAVVGTRKFEVLEREQMENALSELNLIDSGVTNGEDDEAPESNKMKAAGYVIYGNILFYGVDASESAAASNLRTKVELQIKITNAETGKILAQKSIIGIGQESRLNHSGTTHVSNIREQCERAAVAEAAHYVVDALRDVCYPAKVVRVGKKNVTINMTNEEVEIDDLFDVIEAGEELFDEDTGTSLGNEGDDVGRVRIVRTGPKTSVAEPVDDLDLDDVEVGYIIRRVNPDVLKKEKAKAKKKRTEAFESRF